MRLKPWLESHNWKHKAVDALNSDQLPKEEYDEIINSLLDINRQQIDQRRIKNWAILSLLTEFLIDNHIHRICAVSKSNMKRQNRKYVVVGRDNQSIAISSNHLKKIKKNSRCRWYPNVKLTSRLVLEGLDYLILIHIGLYQILRSVWTPCSFLI